MTGKMVVPIIATRNSTYTANFQQTDVHIETTEDLRKFTSRIRDMGFYPYLTDTEEMERLQSDRAQADSIFRRLMACGNWVRMDDG